MSDDYDFEIERLRICGTTSVGLMVFTYVLQDHSKFFLLFIFFYIIFIYIQVKLSKIRSNISNFNLFFINSYSGIIVLAALSIYVRPDTVLFYVLLATLCILTPILNYRLISNG